MRIYGVGLFASIMCIVERGAIASRNHVITQKGDLMRRTTQKGDLMRRT